jgi:hypothetical protein
MTVVWVVVSVLVTIVVAAIAFWSGYFRGWHSGIEWADREWWETGARSDIRPVPVRRRPWPPPVGSPAANASATSRWPDQQLKSGRAGADDIKPRRESQRLEESEQACTSDSKAK